jgi:hypothetical protein
MGQYKYAEIADTVYFWFAANTTAGAAGDGASPLYDVRLAGGAAGDAPTASGTPTLLTHANYTDGLHEIAIDTTGYAAGEYAVFCTLTISTVNPAGFCGSFKLRAAGSAALKVDANVTQWEGHNVQAHTVEGVPIVQLRNSAGSAGISAPTNFEDLSIVDTTGLVDITQTAADKVWGTAARVLTANTNLANLEVDLTKIHGSAITETAGQLAAGFTKFFDVGVPVLTTASVNQTGDSFAIVNGDHGLVSIQDDVDAIYAATITNAAGADVAADIIALKLVADTIQADTDLLDDAIGGLADIHTDVAAIATTIGVAGAGLTAVPPVTLANGAHGGAAATLALGGAGGLTGAITGNLSGSVGSVTGAVGSVTAAVTITSNADITAILADTNELQTDLVNGGRLDLLIDGIKTKTDGLPSGISKNTALANFEFLMVLSSDHVTPATGKTVTATRSIDGAAFGACANAVSEVASGIYKINLAAADLNGDVITFKFAEATCDTRVITIITEAA